HVIGKPDPFSVAASVAGGAKCSPSASPLSPRAGPKRLRMQPLRPPKHASSRYAAARFSVRREMHCRSAGADIETGTWLAYQWRSMSSNNSTGNAMARLKFGAFLAPHHPIGEHPMLQFRRDIDFVQQLDELGYDEFWCGEHHSSGWEMIASPEMFLAAAGER